MIAIGLAQALGISLATFLIGLTLGTILTLLLLRPTRERLVGLVPVSPPRAQGAFTPLGAASPSFPSAPPQLWMELMGARTVGAVPSEPLVLAYDSSDPAAILVLHRIRPDLGDPPPGVTPPPLREFVLSRELLRQALTSGTGEWGTGHALGSLSTTRIARLIGPECDLLMLEHSPGGRDALFQFWVDTASVGKFLDRTLALVDPAREAELVSDALDRLLRP